ncbi:type II secretion system protein [Undibacterium sp. Ji50W]|uniref:type II secretion system protein n=1 Tax=Undibacterium sp. Ji50W TaxID=3413041 RepID=UPI003BF12064
MKIIPRHHMLPCTLRQSGFTYVGAMIVVAIIGVATVATATVADTVRRRTAEEELLTVGQQYIKAILEYELNTPAGNANRAPSRLEDLLRDPRQAGVKRYIRQLYPDPITGKLDWQLVAAPGGGIMGIKSSSCATSIKRSFTHGDFTYLDGQKRYCDWIFAYVMACGANCKDGEKPQRESSESN